METWSGDNWRRSHSDRPSAGAPLHRPLLLARLKRRDTKFPCGLGFTANAPFSPVMSSDRWSSSSAKGSSLLPRCACQPYSWSSSARRSGRVRVMRRVISRFKRPCMGCAEGNWKAVESTEEKLDGETCRVWPRKERPTLDGVRGESTSVTDSPSVSDFSSSSTSSSSLSSRKDTLSSRRKVCMSRLKLRASVVMGGK